MKMPRLSERTSKTIWTAVLFSGHEGMVRHALESLAAVLVRDELTGRGWRGRSWFDEWIWAAFVGGRPDVLKGILDSVPVGSPLAASCAQGFENRFSRGEFVSGWTAECIALVGAHPVLCGVRISRFAPGFHHSMSIFPPLVRLVVDQDLVGLAGWACRQMNLPLAHAVAGEMRGRGIATLNAKWIGNDQFTRYLNGFRKVFGEVAPDTVTTFKQFV